MYSSSATTPYGNFSVKELEDPGVARLSLGASVTKAAFMLIKKIAGELLTDGTYNILRDSLSPLQEASEAYSMVTGTPVQNSVSAVGKSSNS